MQLLLFGRARRDIAIAVGCWRANRPAAANLLEDELERALHQLEDLPASGTPASDVRLPGFRRVSLLQTRYFLYYRVNETKDRIEVLRLWHMSRRRPPAIP